MVSLHVIDEEIYILQDRVKERNTHSKNDTVFTSSIQSSKVIIPYSTLISFAISLVIYLIFIDYYVQYQDFGSRSSMTVGSAVSFSDDEDAAKTSGSKSTRGRKVSSRAAEDTSTKTSTRGRGRGRGRGSSSSLKQTTLDAALGFRKSQRFFLIQFIVNIHFSPENL